MEHFQRFSGRFDNDENKFVAIFLREISSQDNKYD